MNMKKNKLLAFTLAEMMVVLLILSIITAAFMPVITGKMKTSSSSPWSYASNGSDIFFGLANTQGAAIGRNNIDSLRTRLLLNTSQSGQNHINFQQAGVNTGRLTVDGNSNVGLGGVNFGSTTPTTTGIVLIGTGASSSIVPDASGSSVIGENALSTGFRGVSIGSGSRSNAAGAVAIGSWNTYYGTTDKNTTASGASSVAIGRGTTASSAYSIAMGDQVVASGLNSIAIGSATTPSSETTASGNYSIAMGLSAKANIQNSVAIGYGASTSGSATNGSVAIGFGAKANDYSVAIGYQALNVASGIRNVAIGYRALPINSSGDQNVAIGPYSLLNNTTGRMNVSLGPYTLRSNSIGDHNIGFGYQTLYDNTTGSANVAVGVQALWVNETGSNNTALGSGACAGVTGSNKVCIGSGSGPTSAPYTSDNVERIFIGKPSHRVKFRDCTLMGLSCTDRTWSMPSNAGIVEIHNNATSSSDDTAMVVVNASMIVRGNLYIADDASGGDLRMIRDKNSATSYDAFATPYDTYLGPISDRRLKNVGAEFTSALEKIRELKVYNYTFKNDKEKTSQVGVIAQDLQKVFPDAVEADKKGYLHIRLEDMFYSMINSIKELDKMVQEIVAKIQTLDDKISALIRVDQVQNKKLDAIYKELDTIKKENKELRAQIKVLKSKK